MAKHSSYLASQIAQEFEFEARLGHWTLQPEAANSVLPTPAALTRCILSWTEGQPFLTYRLYEVVLRSPKPAADVSPGESLSDRVDRLIHDRCIDRCTDPELLKHLQRICRVLLDDPRSLQLLEVYRGVLQGDPAVGDRPSSLRRRLIQTGLVKTEGQRLQVSNRFYRTVFGPDWVERALHTAQRRASRNSPPGIRRQQLERRPEAATPEPKDEAALAARALSPRRGDRSALWIGLAVVTCAAGALLLVLLGDREAARSGGFSLERLLPALTQDEFGEGEVDRRGDF